MEKVGAHVLLRDHLLLFVRQSERAAPRALLPTVGCREARKEHHVVEHPRGAEVGTLDCHLDNVERSLHVPLRVAPEQRCESRLVVGLGGSSTRS
eukprot:1383899-Prymnesium_polylepis.1